MRSITVESELPTGAEQVWEALRYPVTFLYVVHPLLSMPVLAGRSAPFEVGETGEGWLLLLGLVPVSKHRIQLLEVDDTTMTMRTAESGGVLRRWNHTLHVEPVASPGSVRCRYVDTVDIDAGPLTPVAVRVARGLFRYRHLRWRRLVRLHLSGSPAGRGTAGS